MKTMGPGAIRSTARDLIKQKLNQDFYKETPTPLASRQVLRHQIRKLMKGKANAKVQ